MESSRRLTGAVAQPTVGHMGGIVRGRLIIPTLALVGLGGCWGFSPKQQTYQTAASIEAGISNHFNEYANFIGNLTSKWTVLSDQQYDAVIKRISTQRTIATAKGWKPGQVLKDAWGRRYHIAMKNDDLVVWSDGPDGKENTLDDIISPHVFHGKLPLIPTTFPSTQPRQSQP